MKMNARSERASWSKLICRLSVAKLLTVFIALLSAERSLTYLLVPYSDWVAEVT
jgi:hypothetical protein